MENVVNKYFLNQLLNGGNVQMYEAEIKAIKKHLSETKPHLAEKISTKKQDNSKLVLCRIL